jgi:hypothetical protein
MSDLYSDTAEVALIFDARMRHVQIHDSIDPNYPIASTCLSIQRFRFHKTVSERLARDDSGYCRLLHDWGIAYRQQATCHLERIVSLKRA